MDFTSFGTYLIPIVLVACLILGYILKNWINDVDNKYIPTILALFGAVVNIIYVITTGGRVGVETVVYGAFTGLASTGLHQMFKQYIDNKKE